MLSFERITLYDYGSSQLDLQLCSSQHFCLMSSWYRNDPYIVHIRMKKSYRCEHCIGTGCMSKHFTDCFATQLFLFLC